MKLSREHFLELAGLCYDVTEQTSYKAEIDPNGMLWFRHEIEENGLSFTVHDLMPEHGSQFQPLADISFSGALMALRNLLTEKAA